MASRKHLLVAMDAFGTLFSPKATIADQYVAVASKCGIQGLKTEDIHNSFYTSYKHMVEHYPNYGKKNGLNAELWWQALIEKTFQPHLSEKQTAKMSFLVPDLIQRFWCADGYALHQDAYRFVQSLKIYRETYGTTGSVFLGVLSNSDTRLPDILRSFKYKVANVGVNSEDKMVYGNSAGFDFQFVVLSYNVGHEKPAKEIFDAAEAIVRTTLMLEEHVDDEMTKIYVGDEMRKDGLGARNAGWHAVVVERADTKLPEFEGFTTFVDRLCQAESENKVLLDKVSSLG